jgi:predicted dehydrogenase
MSAAQTVAVGLLGSSFMGRAHSRALYLLPTLEDAPAAIADLKVICGRDQARLAAISSRFGWQRSTTDWTELTRAPDIAAIVNAATNDLHSEPTIQAANAGKHILCEKPLARSATEAKTMLDVARRAGVVHMCAFNYRFFPAVRLARDLVAAGEIGDVLNFRSRFLLASAADPAPETAWRLQRSTAGSGVVGDLLAHHIDLARFLVGEPSAVSAASRTGETERHGVAVDVEDAVVASIEFTGGAIGTMEATRLTPGHVLESAIQIDGSRGTIGFDVQRLNELVLSGPSGQRTISVTEPHHPFIGMWWPRGHGIGWGDSFVHQARHFLGAIADAWPVAPDAATFHDGYRCALVCDAILMAAETGERQPIPAGLPFED